MLQFVSISSTYSIAKFENSETLRSQKCMLSDPQAKKSTCVCFELWNRISSRNCIGANIECFKQKNMGRKSHDTVTLRPTSNLHRFYILTLLCHEHCTVHTMCNFWKIRISRQIEPSSKILYPFCLGPIWEMIDDKICFENFVTHSLRIGYGNQYLFYILDIISCCNDLQCVSWHFWWRV